MTKQKRTFIKDIITKQRITRFVMILILWALCFVVWLFSFSLKHETTAVNQWLPYLLDGFIGALPTVIVFNVLYEFVIRESMPKDISQKIMDTMMGNPEVIDLFNRRTKIQFLKSTLESLTSKEKSKVTFEIISPFIDQELSLRYAFHYKISLHPKYRENAFFSQENYIGIEQRLKYSKKIEPGEKKPKYIGFFLDQMELDKEFRNSDFIFRETLQVEYSDYKRLLVDSAEAQKGFLEDVMSLKLYINDSLQQYHYVFSEKSIIIVFDYDINELDVNFEIGFSMPQKSIHKHFWVSICEPTKDPCIELNCCEGMSVTMYPFFIGIGNKPVTVENAAHFEGSHDITAKDWVLPMSGVSFVIQPKAE